MLKPGRLLEFLDVNLKSSPEELAQGIEDMMTYPSGNYVIDEPFLRMYQVVAARGRAAGHVPSSGVRVRHPVDVV